MAKQITQGEKILIGNIFGLIGSVLLIVGPFLAWVTLGIIKADAFQKAPNYAYIIVGVGVIGLIISIIGIVMKTMAQIVTIIVSICGLGVVIYLYTLLQDSLAGQEVFGVSPSIGPGPFVSGLGALIIFIGAAVTVKLKK